MGAIWSRPAARTAADDDDTRMMVRYVAWANATMMRNLDAMPAAELTRERPTTFKTILATANHIYVVEDIFRAHLEGRTHPYTWRNTDTVPALGELSAMLAEMDAWFIAYADGLDADALAAVIDFEFVGGGAGRMSRRAILNHLAVHAAYHRGFIGDMMNQCGTAPEAATDLPVFLRDVWFA